MSTNTPTPRTDAAEQRDITGLGVVPVHFARQLECDLARVTAERDNEQYRREVSEKALHDVSATATALRARVAELEQENESLKSQRNAELAAALRDAAAGLRNCMDMLDELDGLDWGEDGMPFTIDWDYLKPLLARAESAGPAKQSPAIDAEPMIAACIPGGSICDPQQVADAIREYLHQQEPCGGRYGDPDCDLDTNGVTMRAPAPHADTVRLDWLAEVDTYQRLHAVRLALPITGYPTATANDSIRAAIDAARNGGAK